jgi:hypothetical protein
MTEYNIDNFAREDSADILSGGPVETAAQASSLHMPFERDSQEAEALRGALSFLFTLITTYDEFLGSEGASLHETAGDRTSH